MASSLSISRASAVMGTILERSIDIPRDITFRGNLTLKEESGGGVEVTLKPDELIKVLGIVNGNVNANKALIVDSDKSIVGVNNQTNTGQFIFDKATKVPLYFHPPTTTSNSRKIIALTIEPTDILLIKPFLLDRFVSCSVIFNIITTKRNKTATAPT